MRLDRRLLLFLTILSAAVVRLSFLGHDSLSHDEAARALDAWSAPLEKMRWYPPLHYVLNWTVRHVFGGSEFALRLPSALAGIACVIVLFLFARRHFDWWSGVCVAAVAAFHIELVAYSRFFKEFSIDALMCLVVTWAGVSASNDLSRRRLLTFTMCGILALSFSYTAPLILAAWTAVLGWCALVNGPDRRRAPAFRHGSIDGCHGQAERGHASALAYGKDMPAPSAWAWHPPQYHRNNRYKALVPLITMAGLLTVACLLWYLWLSGAWNRDGAAHDYGVRRGAWPAAYDFGTLVHWFFKQSYGALQYVLGIAPLYPPVDTLIGSFELLLIAAALRTFRKKCPTVLAACAVLIPVTVVMGAARLWPYGKFHTMLFLVPPACLFIGCGLRRMACKFGASAPTLMLVLVCVLNPAARAVKNTVIYPPETEHLRPVLAYVDRRAKPGDGLFSYYAAGYAVRHYWNRDDVPVLIQPTMDRGRRGTFSERFASFIAEHGRVWFVFTHDWQNEREEWIDLLKNRYRLLDHFEVADASAHLFENRRAASDDTESKSTGMTKEVTTR